jgi:hypothetical protein
MVWGDSWLPESWEMEEGFARKYRELVDEEALACTNFWREQRGEEILDLEKLDSANCKYRYNKTWI